LPGAVRAHDRVDLALADLQVDALEDLGLGAGGGSDAEAADDEGVGLVGHDVIRAPWMSSVRTSRCGTRSARVIDSRGPVIASRTRAHRTLTVQRELRSQTRACSGSSVAQSIGAIGPSRARRISLIRISSGARVSSWAA